MAAPKTYHSALLHHVLVFCCQKLTLRERELLIEALGEMQARTTLKDVAADAAGELTAAKAAIAAA